MIVRRTLDIDLSGAKSGPAPDAPLVVPDLTSPVATPIATAIDMDLDVPAMNVPGFLVQPTHLAWDPATQQVAVDATVTSIETVTGATDARLSAPTQFGFNDVLLSHGLPYTGSVFGPTAIDRNHPTAISLHFLSVDHFDPDDSTLLIGAAGAPPATLPLGSASLAAVYPPAPTDLVVTGDDLVADDWTVHPVSARLGFLQASTRPAPGKLQLELVVDVTASPAATVRALGLSFSPKYQVLLTDPTGYEIQPVSDSGEVEHSPGQTMRFSVLFEVPDSFTAGTLGYVIRGHSEIGELAQSYTEADGTLQIGTDAAQTAGGGL